MTKYGKPGGLPGFLGSLSSVGVTQGKNKVNHQAVLNRAADLIQFCRLVCIRHVEQPIPESVEILDAITGSF